MSFENKKCWTFVESRVFLFFYEMLCVSLPRVGDPGSTALAGYARGPDVQRQKIEGQSMGLAVVRIN